MIYKDESRFYAQEDGSGGLWQHWVVVSYYELICIKELMCFKELIAMPC